MIIIGGGVIGTAHAREALKAGHHVVHLERDALARSASVRNFGLVWVSGRRSGAELESGLRARALWEEIHREIPAMDFRPNGSMTLAVNEAELAVMQECMEKGDAHQRQWQLLDKKEVQKINPALKGNYLAGLWCPLDASVEPSKLLLDIRDHLVKNKDYTWRNNVDIIDVSESETTVIAISRSGERFEADYLIHCPGADHSSLFGEHLEAAPIRRVRLQMMSTAVFDQELTTSLADGDSMRYYPGYDVPTLSKLPPQHPVAEKNHMQLLLVQRKDGTLTIGDTHEYKEPFEFKLHEGPYQYLHDLASDLIGTKIPPIIHRWDGIYSQQINGEICDRRQISTNIISVTGPGGRGNTLAPAIAEETLKGL
ncbi:MAG: TIGR03364 family FAD-dependent oxidoreductase [Actinomycetales bacterium]|nr:MAG: TIGR03364 family FAD-dependent oxidoreductase [Actinomycetales bacterium]